MMGKKRATNGEVLLPLVLGEVDSHGIFHRCFWQRLNRLKVCMDNKAITVAASCVADDSVKGLLLIVARLFQHCAGR